MARKPSLRDDGHNPKMAWALFAGFCLLASAIRCTANDLPNIILILADDLGYGDLGWGPFYSEEMKHVQTPNLQRLAQEGMIFDNFHTASPICSPSRVSILTGLFPWRLGVDFIYSQDLKEDGSEELDHEELPMIPNVPMALRDIGYFTAHIGKWHLGGQTDNDIVNRRTNISCKIPGILQYGFDEYVSMTEGHPSNRLRTHAKHVTYTEGSKYFIRNDYDMPPTNQILTDRQTDEAIRVLREQVRRNAPFFLNIWYDAPHSPWEAIPPFYEQFENKFHSEQNRKYASMISNMDQNIGRILDEIKAQRIEENTLILFFSDNGPENAAGSAGQFEGRKRLMKEGGIRVPAIFSWKGKIVPNSKSSKFVLTTDLFPTLMEISGRSLPSHIKSDGVSFLPILKGTDSEFHKYGDERVIIWYSHCPNHPKFSAIRSHGIKIIWNDYLNKKNVETLPPVLRLYDMYADIYERSNLYPEISRGGCALNGTTRWEDISKIDHTNIKSKEYIELVSHLMNFLLIKLYHFRTFGQNDWLLYHGNKPITFENSCAIRSSNLPSFEWTNPFISPDFCGDGIANLIDPFLCKCQFSNCSSVWKSSTASWLSGNIFLEHGFQISKSYFSKLSKLNLPPHCKISEMQPSQGQPPLRLGKEIPTFGNWMSRYFSSLNIAKHGAWSMSGYCSVASLNCFQRVQFRDGKLKPSGSGCGFDESLLTLNPFQVRQSISLCESSYQKFFPWRSESLMDDNLFAFALNRLAFLEHNASSTKISIVDPLFFHLVDLDSSQQASLAQSSIFKSQEGFKLLSGFWASIPRNIFSIEHTILFPLQFDGCWGLSMVVNDGTQAQLIFLHPALSLLSSAEQSKFLDEMQLILTSSFREFGFPGVRPFTSVLNLSPSGKPNCAVTGIQVFAFLEAALQARNRVRNLKIDWNKIDIDSKIQDLHRFLQH